MAFTDSRLRGRVQRLEREARDRPRCHALRLTAYILIGYLWPLVLLAACAIAAAAVLSLFLLAWNEAGVQGVLAWLVLLCAVPFTLYVLVGAMMQDPAPIPGQQVSEQEAPELFTLIERVRLASGAPPLAQVNLDQRTNAAMVQRRRFEIWGTTRYHLVLGVPLLAALTPRHLEAVLAHEFGHATSRRDRFGAWVYRVVRTWTELTQTAQGKPTVHGRVLGWFAAWYVPWLMSSTLAIRRLHEYDADKAGADLLGPEAAASALAAVNWAEYRLGRTFQAVIWHEAAQQELPPGDFMQRLMGFLAADVDPAWVAAWRSIELQRKGRVTDEHPALIERITAMDAARVLRSTSHAEGCAALGVPITITPELSALSLLGTARERAIRQTNAMWKADVIATWRNQHLLARELAREANEARDAREAREETGEPRTFAQRTYSELQTDLRYRDPIAARALIGEYLARFPDHAEANFDMGRLLLAQDDDAGRHFMEKCIAGDSDWARSCLYVLLDYYRSAGRDQEADGIVTRLREYEKTLKSHRRHVSRLGRTERLRPHDLKAGKLRNLWSAVNRFPQVSQAYLAMRDTRILSDKPVYVLAVVPSALTGKMGPRVVRAISESMPVPCTVVVLRWWRRRLRRRITEVCPAPVFEESRRA